MPIYEYRCADCQRRVSLFFRSIAAVEEQPACPHCGARALIRRMSRVWWHSRSAEVASETDASLIEQDDVPFYGGDSYDMSDSAGGADEGFDDGDVIELARETREMARLMGEPLDDDLDVALRHIEAGADPDDVLGELDEGAQDSTDDAG